MFAENLAPYGIALEAPDFNQPSFQTLTTTRMIEQALAAIDHRAGPVALIGSSLGAFVAAHVAARHAAVEKAVLLAPALDFAETRMRDLGVAAIAKWRETGLLDVFHYGFGRVVPVGYALYEDAALYDALGLELTQPILVFQGLRDTVVNPAVPRRFAATRTNVTLRMLDDDHQLLGSMPVIWEESREFLGLPPLR
jgi:hypothetical protein